MVGSGEMPPMRRSDAVLLVLLCAACSRETTPGSTAQAAPAPAKKVETQPSAQPKVEPAASSVVLQKDAGLVAGAQAERVLHVGDSMVPLVGNYLRKVAWSKGKKYYIQSVASSSSLDWGSKRWLQDAMYKYDPDLILISLGSNELFDPDPGRRASAVRQIVDDTRGRPCLWIGPPLWKKDTGFIEVVKKNLGHCQYFDSSKLDLPRMEDGRHPNWTGGWRWASAVYKFLGGTEPVPTDSPGSDLKPERTASP